MNLPIKLRIDELIDAHGSIALAIASRQACIERRKAEGKGSPVAAVEVALLSELPPTYRTPKEQSRDENERVTASRD